jgi:hypothetical protein
VTTKCERLKLIRVQKQMKLVFLSEHGHAVTITQTLIQGWAEFSPTNNCKPASCKNFKMSTHYTRHRARGGAVQTGRIFHWHNSSGRTMALGSNQPLTEMSIRNISWGKGGGCVGLTTLPPSCADFLKILEPQSPGTLRACQSLWWDCFTFTIAYSRRFLFSCELALYTRSKGWLQIM